MDTQQTFTLVTDTGLLVLIWIVQVAAYPSFRYVDQKDFAACHRNYTRKMGFIAGPLMIAQLSLAGLNVWTDPQSLHAVRHLTLVIGSWIVTFAVSVRLHNKLQTLGKHMPTIDTLVSTNWIRTAIWTATFGISLFATLSE